MSSSLGARGSGEREVLPQGADEDVVLLGDQRDVAAQVGERQLDQADPAHGHRAGAGRVDAGQQPAERRLAGAGRPDHRDPLADTDLEVDAVQDVATLDVGEPDVGRVQLLADRLRTADLAVVGHLGHAEQPGQRGRAHLQLVEDRHDPVHRVDEHLHVEGRRGDLAEGDAALGVEVAAEQERRDRRDQVGQLHAREEHGAQVERVALRGVGLADVVVDRPDPLGTEPEGLHGPGALDGLGQRRVDRGVRRGLAQVAVLGPGEVPAQPDHQRRQAETHRQQHPPADRHRGDERDDRGDDRDRPLGQRPAHRPAELVDVAAGAGEQVAGAGRLDHADRQRQRVADEVLAQLGQHLLAEHLAGQPRVAREHRLHDQEDGQRQHHLVHVADGRALVDRLDEVAEQPGCGQPGQRGTEVQRQRGPEQPRVSSRQAAHVAAQRPGVGDRQRGADAHVGASAGSADSRVTTAR